MTAIRLRLRLCRTVKGAIYFWKDVDKTCESIAKISPEDAIRYKKFVTEWEKLNEGVFQAFLKPPTMLEFRQAFGFRHEVEKSGGYGSQTDDFVWRVGQTNLQTRRLAGGDGVDGGAVGTAADGDGERRFFRLAFDAAQKRCQTSERRFRRRIDPSDGAVSDASRRRSFIKRCEVAKIEVSNNETGGIILENGDANRSERASSPTRTFNTTFLKLIGAENLPEGLGGKNRKRPHRQRFRNDRPLRRLRIARLSIRAERRKVVRNCHHGLQLDVSDDGLSRPQLTPII